MSNFATAAKPKIGGAIYVAPEGTALPTSASASLNAAFQSLGYVSDDGLTNTIEKSHEEIKAWGGDIIASEQTGVADRFKFKLVEALKDAVLKTVFGASNVSGSLAAGISIAVNASSPKRFAWVVDMIMADDVIKRIVIPSGKITEIGDIVYKEGEVVGYDATMLAFPDASGNSHYEYIYGATNVVAKPVITISSSSATITCATAGATIYYTKNGVTPSPASAVYSSAVTVNSGETIKAYAVKADMLDSEVASETRA